MQTGIGAKKGYPFRFLFLLFTIGGIYFGLTISLGKYDYSLIIGFGKLYCDSH
jgi:hypothetical protein